MIKKDHSENHYTQTALSDIEKYIEENFKRNNINIANDQLETEKITKKKNKNNIRHKETIIQIQNTHRKQVQVFMILNQKQVKEEQKCSI